MSDDPDVGKRLLLTGAALGTGLAAFGVPRGVEAQPPGGGFPASSVLAKLQKGAALQVGYAQTPVWFYRDAKTGQLQGIYHDLVERLGKELNVKIDWHEVTFANLTLGLRKGDYDLFGSSAIYTVPRALAANYIGPLWSKGEFAIVRKADAAKYKTVADLDSPEVTFAVNAGASEQNTLPGIFPKAKFIAVTGQVLMAAEPVRAGRATAFVIGDSDAIAFVKRNSWAQIVDPERPFNKRPNTWLVRYGDDPWKNFLDMWASYINISGDMQRLYDQYMSRLG
jgi:ABC-type amino acid transport substrate-binding protein